MFEFGELRGNKNEMKKWYFDLAEFKAEVGFKFQFSGGPPEKQYLHLCEVTEIIPEKKFGKNFISWYPKYILQAGSHRHKLCLVSCLLIFLWQE